MLRIICGTKRLNLFFRLYKASEVLHKYAIGVWSDNLAAAFVVSFNASAFVPDIKRIQNKVICLWTGTTTCSVNVMSTYSANWYDNVANLPEGPST